MLVSYHEGRIRLRFEQLRNPLISVVVKKYILGIEGITSVEIKSSTGSLLVGYDPLILPTEKLFSMGKEGLAKFGIELSLPEN